LKQIKFVVILLTMIPLIASIGIIPALPFAQAATSMGCTQGNIHLKNPNTGDIICVKPDEAKRSVGEGWIALDKIPEMHGSASDCKPGWIHLKNPSTGEIICATPHEARGFVGEAGWEPSHSPNKQSSNGVLPHEIVCRGGLDVIIRNSGDANCVKSTTHNKMRATGIGLTPLAMGCTQGNIHLKNPNTGAIVCEKQSDAPKFVNEGWLALDKISAMGTTAPAICKGGETKLMNPNTGDITCAKPEETKKFVGEGWIRTEPLTATVQSSDVVMGDTIHTHMVQIETVHVMPEPSEPDAYHVTYKIKAGDQPLKNIKILIVSDTEKVTGTVSMLGDHAEITHQVRIHATDAGSIIARISHYQLE
jgi:hypothetical protein